MPFARRHARSTSTKCAPGSSRTRILAMEAEAREAHRKQAQTRQALLACEDPSLLPPEDAAQRRALIAAQLHRAADQVCPGLAAAVAHYLIQRLVEGPQPVGELVRECALQTDICQRRIYQVRNLLALRSIRHPHDRRKRLWDLPEPREIPEPALPPPPDWGGGPGEKSRATAAPSIGGRSAHSLPDW